LDVMMLEKVEFGFQKAFLSSDYARDILIL